MKENYMLTKKKLTITLSLASALVLSACSNQLSSAQKSAENIQAKTDEMITEFDAIAANEAELQGQFESTLAEDAELATFADESSPVFENITNRKESVDTLGQLNEDLQSDVERLSGLDEAELPSNEIQVVTDSANQLISQLESYIESYDQALTSQSDYFKSLANEDANYETFASGMQEINEQDQNITELATEIEASMADVKSANQALVDSLNSLSEAN